MIFFYQWHGKIRFTSLVYIKRNKLLTTKINRKCLVNEIELVIIYTIQYTSPNTVSVVWKREENSITYIITILINEPVKHSK